MVNERAGTNRCLVGTNESLKTNQSAGFRLLGVRRYGLLIVLSVIWGGAFVAIREADSFDLSSVNLTLLRWMIVAASFLVLYPFIVKPKAKFERKDFPRLLLVALTSVVIYHLSLNASEKIVDASLAGLLISLAPLFIVLLSVLVLREKVGLRLGVALLIAISGAAVISSPDLSLSSGSLAGPLLVVLAAFSSAVFTVSSKPLVGKYGPFPVAAWSAFLGTALLLPLLSVSTFQQAESLPFYGWTSILYLSMLSTVVANLIFYTLVSRQAVSRLSVQLYLVPIVSAAGGVLVLGEALGVTTVVGGALLLVAVGLATSLRH